MINNEERTGLQVRDLHVAYGDVSAVGPLSLTVPSGSLLVITGPSGAGKTSLLWAIAGAVQPTSGVVSVHREVISDHRSAIAAGVVLIPQGNGLARILTARENIQIALAGGSADQVEKALHSVALADSGQHLVEELSGGQQQRVAVARGVAQRGTVLLADESTSELDSANRALVLGLLRAEADRGAAVLFATNDLDAAADCDAQASLDEGRLAWVRLYAT